MQVMTFNSVSFKKIQIQLVMKTELYIEILKASKKGKLWAIKQTNF